MPSTAPPPRQPRGPGAYVLVLRLRRDESIACGGLGPRTYRAGWYAYVGSALGGLEQRLQRHRRSQRRPHWHIDYLLACGRLETIVAARTAERLECRLATLLGDSFPVVPRFGSSDCRCAGHLFHSSAAAPLVACALDAVRAVGCTPERMVVTQPTGRESCGPADR